MLDGLIDATALAPPPAIDVLTIEFDSRDYGDNYELLLDSVRQKVGERRFALGVQLIEGISDPIDVAMGYARVAEAAFDVLARATVAEFEKTHGRIAGGELVVLALGRLGGGALTHASDLDLIFLFTGGISVESDGPRLLGATGYFNRLAPARQRSAIGADRIRDRFTRSTPRLRPSGAQGAAGRVDRQLRAISAR